MSNAASLMACCFTRIRTLNMEVDSFANDFGDTVYARASVA